MAKRFDAYRMQDGKTPLSADYFNPVFQDIDLRISDLEQRRTDLQSVMDELSKFGLQRIDALTSRAMADMTAILAELREVRDELTAGTQLAAAITAEAAARNEAISGAVQAEALARAAALASEATARAQAIEQAVAQEAQVRNLALTQEEARTDQITATVSALSVAIQEEKIERAEQITAEATARSAALMAESTARENAITQATAKPSAATFSYDASGRVSGTVETLPDGQRATTLTYGAAGRVSTVAETMGGVTRTTSYSYDASGRVGGFSVAGG